MASGDRSCHGLTTPKEQSAMKRALITGVTGQDGAYLEVLLLVKG